MAKNAPTIMVSSTYYDLRQIRQDLVHFVDKDLGYNVYASEFDTFPIDPDANTIENCRRRVEKEADILVLIIGSRYGFVDAKSNKSVTNLEYLTARAKGIPIYAFVDKGILPLLPVWEKNPKAKFKDIVPDTKVFEFIRQVRSIDSVWTYEFEHAQTIIQTLRIQFAHLMNEGLQATRRLSSAKNSIPEGISGKALRLALEKPKAWEYYLFAQVLIDEVEKYADLREEYRLKISFGSGQRISLSDAARWWINAKTDELLKIVKVAETILGDFFKNAIGPSGSPGDLRAIIFAAKKIGDVYKELLIWSQQVRTIHIHECFRPVIQELSNFTENPIEQIGNYGPFLTEQIDHIVLQPESQAEINLKMTFTLNTDLYLSVFEKAQQEYLELMDNETHPHEFGS